jgi:hypothetical protein
MPKMLRLNGAGGITSARFQNYVFIRESRLRRNNGYTFRQDKNGIYECTGC